MKTFLLTLAAGLFMAQATYSQTKQEQMTNIDQKKQDIDNNIGSYQKSMKFKDGTNSKSVFKDGNELKMVSISIIDENVDKKVQWYFENGKLIYAQVEWTNISTGILVNNQRTYVDNKQAFSWIKAGNVSVSSSSREFKDMDSELMVYAANLQKDSMK